MKLKFCELTDSQELDMEVGTALGAEPGESEGCIQEGGREPRGIGIQTGMERVQRASRGALKECKDTRGRGEGITPNERGLYATAARGGRVRPDNRIRRAGVRQESK